MKAVKHDAEEGTDSRGGRLKKTLEFLSEEISAERPPRAAGGVKGTPDQECREGPAAGGAGKQSGGIGEILQDQQCCCNQAPNQTPVICPSGDR